MVCMGWSAAVFSRGIAFVKHDTVDVQVRTNFRGKERVWNMAQQLVEELKSSEGV